MERFFRNLLLDEHWELKSRYLLINPPAEYAEQPKADWGDVTENVTEKSANVTENVTEKLTDRRPSYGLTDIFIKVNKQR